MSDLPSGPRSVAESATPQHLPASQWRRVRDALDRLPAPPPQTDAQRARNLFGARAKARRHLNRQRRARGLQALLLLLASASLVSALRRPREKPETDRAPLATAAAAPEAWLPADVGDQGSVFVRPGSAYRLPPAGAFCSALGFEVELHSGVLCAEVRHRDLTREAPFTIVTAELAVQDVGTAFCVEADSGHSSVSVAAGSVRVARRGGQFVPLNAGHWLGSEDPALPPPASPGPALHGGARRAATVRVANAREGGAELPPAHSDCLPSADLAARRACLWAASRESSFAGENALYGLALLDSTESSDPQLALADLGDYQRRFAGGHLAGEAAFLRVRALVRHGETQAAADEAARFDDRFPGHPLSDDVRYQRALLMGHERRDCAAAAKIFTELLARPLRPGLRQAVASSLSSCANGQANLRPNGQESAPPP